MNKIAAALVKAQKAFGPALKTSNNPHFRSKYADLSACVEAVIDGLNDNGIAIRKLNQAYFAFYGTYADSPQSTNPIGPKIEQVWQKTQDVGVFLKLMREVRDAGDLDRTLAALGD